MALGAVIDIMDKPYRYVWKKAIRHPRDVSNAEARQIAAMNFKRADDNLAAVAAAYIFPDLVRVVGRPKTA